MVIIDCNLLDAPADLIGHCCNCYCTMGSGVAKAIRAKYPEAYEVDLKTEKGDKYKLGTITTAKVKEPDNRIKYVANIYGQYTFGYGVRQANYEAMYSGLEKVRNFALEQQLEKVAFPYKMASDLAGGDWRIIEKMIEVVYEDFPLTVTICKYTPPGQ